MKTVTRTRECASFSALLFLISSIANGICFGQADPNKSGDAAAAKPPTVTSPETSKAAGSNEPLTDRERAELLELIKNLQERVAKLEAAQTAKATADPVAKSVSDSPIADGSQPVQSLRPAK